MSHKNSFISIFLILEKEQRVQGRSGYTTLSGKLDQTLFVCLGTRLTADVLGEYLLFLGGKVVILISNWCQILAGVSSLHHKAKIDLFSVCQGGADMKSIPALSTWLREQTFCGQRKKRQPKPSGSHLLGHLGTSVLCLSLQL